MQETIADMSFRAKRIEIDGRNFDRCVFDACHFVYSGGALFSFLDCTFEGTCKFLFEGAAERTLQSLRYLRHTGGGASIIENFIRKINEPILGNDP